LHAVLVSSANPRFLFGFPRNRRLRCSKPRLSHGSSGNFSFEIIVVGRPKFVFGFRPKFASYTAAAFACFAVSTFCATKAATTCTPLWQPRCHPTTHGAVLPVSTKLKVFTARVQVASKGEPTWPEGGDWARKVIVLSTLALMNPDVNTIITQKGDGLVLKGGDFPSKGGDFLSEGDELVLKGETLWYKGDGMA
jgi:hypothetical protein